MGIRLKQEITANWLAEKMGLQITGNEGLIIRSICPHNDAVPSSISFTRDFDGEVFPKDRVVFALPNTNLNIDCKIEATNPRLAFARALNILKNEPGFILHQKLSTIPEDVKISSSATIGKAVKIGCRTVIGHNVVIYDGVSIGEDCYIKSNTVIGEDGFGFERDENGLPVRIQHIGSVRIGNRVEIGSLNTICRGTIGHTIIEDDVKIDDHVHVAHNCHLGQKSLVAACVEFSGGVNVGEQCWIGPNSSIKQKITIGDFAFIGIASNVTKDVVSGVKVAGNPARSLRMK